MTKPEHTKTSSYRRLAYRPEIDGLRAVAVLPVLLFHAGFSWFRGGFVGVDVFFVISGYLITSIILADLEAGSFSVAKFYERRARRILPALFVVILACLPAAWIWMVPYQLVAFARSVGSIAAFSSNILFFREVGYFSAAASQKPLLHTWSLSVEEQFYLFFPILLAVLWKLGKRTIVSVFVIVGFTSVALAEWGWRQHPDANFFLTPTRGWELLIGAMVALIHFERHEGVTRLADTTWVSELGSLIGLAMIAYAVGRFDEATPSPSVFMLLPTLGAALIILFASPMTAVGRALGLRAMVGVGLISYSVYLWHFPLFAFAKLRGVDKPGSVAFAALVVVSVALAYVTWRFVEQPFRDKQRVSRKAIFVATLVASVGMLGVAAVVEVNHGFVSRFPNGDRYLVALDPSTQGRFVSTRFIDLKLAPYEAGKRKVFIVGDSFAQDFVNAYAENGYLRNASVSTFPISAACGAILSKDDLTQYIVPSERAACRRSERFESQRVQRHLREADVVILAGSWKDWQAARVMETLDSLRVLGARMVLVIGGKSFGDVLPLRYVGLSDQQKKLLRNPVDSTHRVASTFMRTHLPSSVFVDLQMLVCGDEATCPVFTDDLKLISFDGDHLTQDGARYVGQRLFDHPLLAPLK